MKLLLKAMEFKKMKRKFILLILGILFLSLHLFSQNDYYVKIIEHKDSLYIRGQYFPPQNKIFEMWIGEKRFAYKSPSIDFLFDYEKDSVTVVNKFRKIYYTLVLPMSLSKYFDSNLLSEQEKILGSVKESNDEKIIDNRKCKSYEIECYILKDGEHYYDEIKKVWVTNDIPFNIDIYYKSIYNINRFLNYEDSLLEGLDKIKGFILKSEASLYQRGDEFTRQNNIVEIKKRVPGKEIYSIPAGFKKIQKITQKEIMDVYNLNKYYF